MYEYMFKETHSSETW